MRWWMVIVWLLSGQAWAANVLVIQSYHSGYAWDAAYTKGLKEGINAQHQLHFLKWIRNGFPLENTARLPIVHFKLISN